MTGRLVLALCLSARSLSAQGDSVRVRLLDADIRTAALAVSRFLDRPVIVAGPVSQRITLDMPNAVPRSTLPRLFKVSLQAAGLDLVEDSLVYRVVASKADVVAPASPVPLQMPGTPSWRMSQVPELATIRLRHARASDVAAAVSALYGRASAPGEPGGPAPGPSAEGLAVTGGGPQTARRPAQLQGELHIVPDPASNTLLIRSTRADFELVEAAVREIDVRPLQVVIEVVIVEARRDQSLSFGLDAALATTPVAGGSRATVQGSSSGVGLGDLVVRALGTAGGGLDLTLRAAAARGDVEILSRPVLLAANNQSAEILVGSQRPFVQVAQALPTDAASIRQVVQYRDVGTRLSVRPTISTDGYVMLEVTQEVNAATSEVQFSAPVISTRTVRTRLLVNDGQTAVLGGLTDQQREVSRGGIPLLSAIPVLGGLFGRQQRRAARTELFVFLTPRVIRTDDENAAAARRFGTPPDLRQP